MLKLMQKKALQLYVEDEKSGNDGDGSRSSVSGKIGVEIVGLGLSGDGGDGGLGSSESVNDLGKGSRDGSVLGSTGMRIKEMLEKGLSPVELDVEDISYQHVGHAGVRGSDGETHLNVKVVSEEFEGKSLVKRHRLIYSLL